MPARIALLLWPIVAMLTITGVLLLTPVALGPVRQAAPAGFVELPQSAAEPAPPASGGEQAGISDACKRSLYQDTVGNPLAQATLPAEGPNLRIIRPGTQVTQDFREERLNIAVDENGVIVDIRCG